MICHLTQNRWYKSGKTIPIRGIVVHSSGANNPNLKRYVQPDKSDPAYWEKLAILGTNPYANHWNTPDQPYAMHAFVGKLADGTVAAVQTLPWDSFLHGCGSGKHGSYNQSHIQFEICEDTTDADYGRRAYEAAADLCADLCREFSLNPGTIVSHAEANRLGYASAHADPDHWWNPLGLSMDGFRAAVAARLDNGGSEWSKEARDWAVNAGIVRGDDTGMAWKRPITREEVVQMLYRMQKKAPLEGSWRTK
jgi:hypothetical protein